MGKVSDQLWNKAGKMRIPLTGAFELLPVCNFQCKMCYVRKTMKEVGQEGGLLSAGEWLDFARQARDEGLLYPLLTGGEPFVRDDFQEIMAKMGEMGLQISINTNASLIDEAQAKWLGQHLPTRINITLYGASEETYQNLCGNGEAYARVRRAVDYLKQYGVTVKFNTSITPENVGDLEAMMAYADRMNIPIQVASYMFPPIRRDENMTGQNHRLSPEEAAWARVKSDLLQRDSRWFQIQVQRWNHFVPLTAEMLREQSGGKSCGMSCRAGRCSFWLDWQGNLGNCGMYTSAKFPLKGSSFAKAWEQVAEETDRIRFSPACTNCPNFRLCHSCIAMVYNECGDMNGCPEYLCLMNQASARYYRLCAQAIAEGKDPLKLE
ncbi:MAG: radical SAM protein [Eubacteriales bacterium]|nr:radical SAM protein [Eubacteriales bacterium]